MAKVLSAIIAEENGGYVSLNPDTGVASQVDTIDEVLANLKEALGFILRKKLRQKRKSQNRFFTSNCYWMANSKIHSW